MIFANSASEQSPAFIQGAPQNDIAADASLGTAGRFLGQIFSNYVLFHQENYWRGCDSATPRQIYETRGHAAGFDFESEVMSQQKEIISTLNSLIETLKDGQEGFKQSAQGVDDPQLKTVFDNFSLQRSSLPARCRRILSR
jgi:hypothetical protein